MAKPNLSIFVVLENFGNVFTEQVQIVSKFTELNLPGSTTAGRISLNLTGKTRIIMVQGSNAGDGFAGASQDAKLKAFKDRMEGWVNAKVQSNKTYTDSYGASYSVDCIDWSINRKFDSQGRLLWSLLMKES